MQKAAPAADLRIQVGGTLDRRRHIYITRPEDGEVLRLLSEGEYVNILTSRQTGKSSLVLSTIMRLREQGTRTAYVDLSSLGMPERIDDFYIGLLDKIARDLRLNMQIGDWWAARPHETPSQRLMSFFAQVVGSEGPAPLAIFLDEIDSTLRLDYTDDLFTALRAMYNERSLQDDYKQISFCLVGVATPNELIKGRRTTPYNVGRTIELRGFSRKRDDLTALEAAIGDEADHGDAILTRVLHWTDGHPYLTMRLCSEFAAQGVRTTDDVDRLVTEEFLSRGRAECDPHFQQILRFVDSRMSSGSDSLTLYARILRGRIERDITSVPHMELKLSGLVKRDRDGNLQLNNRIYRKVFDETWVRGTRPRRAVERYRLLAAASVAALCIVGGALYWQQTVLQTQLRDRDRLAQLGITVTTAIAGSGNAVAFQPGGSSTQDKLAEGLRLLRVVTPIVSLDLASTALADLAPLQTLDALEWLDVSYTGVADTVVLSGFADLEWLNLTGTRIATVDGLAGLGKLRWLFLRDTRVSDIAPIAGASELLWLDLGGTGVEDLSPLASARKLTRLNLRGTAVRDLAPLHALAGLQEVDLRGTPVSETEIDALRDALATAGNRSVQIQRPVD
ncbi:MAG: AAA-like domain-containing protein [Pseudomonadota bacterium]